MQINAAPTRQRDELDSSYNIRRLSALDDLEPEAALDNLPELRIFLLKSSSSEQGASLENKYACTYIPPPKARLLHTPYKDACYDTIGGYTSCNK